VVRLARHEAQAGARLELAHHAGDQRALVAPKLRRHHVRHDARRPQALRVRHRAVEHARRRPRLSPRTGTRARRRQPSAQLNVAFEAARSETSSECRARSPGQNFVRAVTETVACRQCPEMRGGQIECVGRVRSLPVSVKYPIHHWGQTKLARHGNYKFLRTAITFSAIITWLNETMSSSKRIAAEQDASEHMAPSFLPGNRPEVQGVGNVAASALRARASNHSPQKFSCAK